jgi:conjugative relaxase-like TrwC/TraI family protein
MAWMRMMGADSVDYHEHTVAGRSDDPVAAAAAYYAAHGETPMTWGGTGRHLLGVDGQVDLADYRAIFATGGAVDPATGTRLVACRRPGLELVVSPHKSVAELGVIGRAEDMHAIVDAERDATLEFLDRLVAEKGGRRGRTVTPTPTGGLVWATSRHATTRAGDPQVHDHVLIANLVAMADAQGGWKGLDTAFLRDQLHAATAVGRMAAAAKAVELGYGIIPDEGPSGRLGGWAIAGIPEEVCALHSTRSAQITAAVGLDASYAARSMAARTTRDRKTRDAIEDHTSRWRAELIAAGHPPDQLRAAVDAAGGGYRPDPPDLDGLAGELLGPGGRLAEANTFTRADVIIAVAPNLHGLPLPALDEAVNVALAHDDAIALPHLAIARHDVWVARCVLSDEARIEALADTIVDQPAPQVDEHSAWRAVATTETQAGYPLTDTQRRVAIGVMVSGQPFELVIGVAGSGKTTALQAVRAGFESAGYRVLGAATSGQAARNLNDGAGIESRTVASLTWRLDRGTVTLDHRDVVVLDEGAMTSDVDIARLLGAVARSGAKLVVVGDDRQLGAIGPGGALTALCDRHPERTWTLSDNLRQTNPHEATALAHLRAGNLPTAVSWYARNNRIHPATDRRSAVVKAVRAWAADMDADRDSLLLAYRRDNVDALNRIARDLIERAGGLTGPELVAPGGRCYRAGDRIVTLAPGPNGAWVTSQTAQVTAVKPEEARLTARTPDGRTLHLGADDIGADRLAHAYAMTAHRAQGATVDTAHVLDDGGGRELAYVAMSRARHASHVYVTAPTAQDACNCLAWSWDDQRRHQWALDQARATQHLSDLRDERGRLTSPIPPDVSRQLAATRAELILTEADSFGEGAERPVDRLAQLEAAAAARRAFLDDHPEIVDRVRQIDQAITAQTKALRRISTISQTAAPGRETPAWEPAQRGGIAL